MASPNSQSAKSASALILVDVINSFFVAGMPNYIRRRARCSNRYAGCSAAARAAGRIVVHAAERHYPGFHDYEWRKLPNITSSAMPTLRSSTVSSVWSARDHVR